MSFTRPHVCQTFSIQCEAYFRRHFPFSPCVALKFFHQYMLLIMELKLKCYTPHKAS